MKTYSQKTGSTVGYSEISEAGLFRPREYDGIYFTVDQLDDYTKKQSKIPTPKRTNSKQKSLKHKQKFHKKQESSKGSEYGLFTEREMIYSRNPTKVLSAIKNFMTNG